MFDRSRAAWVLATLSAVLCAGCPKPDDSEKTAPRKDTAATQPTAVAPATVAPESTGATPVESGRFRKLTGDEVSGFVSQIMAKHAIHPEHSFGLKLKGFDGSVLSTTGPEGKAFVFHVFNAGGKRTISLFDKDKKDWAATKLLAVAFEDVDHDGFEDLVALGSYDKGNGVSVYTRPAGGQFALNSALGKKAGAPSSMAAALAALR